METACQKQGPGCAFLLLLAALLLIVTCAKKCAADEIMPHQVPMWVLRGILATETRSSYREDGTIIYVDKKRGAAGERGPYQMTRAAFIQVAAPGDRSQFWLLEKDPIYAEYMACKYLCWLYNRHRSWRRAIEEYNAGPGHHSPTYYASVRKRGCL